MAQLPPEIITDILIRLPVKSLLRFRCVSKPWCSQIDSPQFTKLHLRRSIQAKSNLSLILARRTWPPFIYSVEFGKLDKAVEVKNPYKELAVSACCNGLLLLKEVSMKEYRLALLNPATRKHKVIPICPLANSHNGVLLKLKGIPNGGPCGLGFDSVNDDYKIISIVQFACNGKWVGSETNIYSLNHDEWKPMKNFPHRLPCVKEWGVHLGGRLHTLVKRNRDGYGCPDVILVTDLVKEDYSYMELPDFHRGNVSKAGINVLEAEESLCFMLVYKGFRTDFWVMKEYGASSSWTKLLSVAPPVLPPLTYMDPLICSKDMDKVLFCMNESKLCWYDIKADHFINVPVRGAPHGFFVDVSVDSLVHPNGYAKANKNQPRAQQKVIKENQANKKRDDFLSMGFKLKL